MAALKICLFLLLGTVIVRGEDDCDALKGSKVCECPDSSLMVCSHVGQGQELVNAFGKLEEGGLGMSFCLKDTKALANLPDNLFRNMQFVGIEMKNVDLPFLGNPLEESSPLSALNAKLVKLKLRNVRYLHNWDWSKVEPFPKLHEIDISDSRFVRIQSSFVKPFLNVVKLDIDSSNVHWIEEGAIPTKNLEKLELPRNFLKDFSIKAFSAVPIGKLEKLNLRENKIEFLEENLLSNMPALRVLELDNNRLFQVTERLFRPWHRDARRNELILYIKGTRTSQEDCKVAAILDSNTYTIEVNSDCK